MNIRDLKYLVAVAEYKHFGKAASACFVSQPALSMQLQKLEETLGVQLFERTNKSVMITEVGQNMADRAQKILQEVDELSEVAQSYQNPFAGELKLGIFPTLAPYLLPKIVPKIGEVLPELKLLLIEEKTEILINKLKKGELDCALLALPIIDDTFEISKLFDDQFLLAVPNNHAFARRKFIKQSDIANQQLLLLEDGHCMRSQALEVCSLMGISEHQDFRATSMETLRQMVASGVGMTLIPQLAKKNNDGITYVPFAKPAPVRTIGLVWRKTTARKDCCGKVAEIVKDVGDI